MALSPANRRPSKITPPRLIIAGGVVLALAVGAWLLLKPKTDVTPYRMAEVTRGDVTSSVSASGTLQALVTVDVGSQISGQIKDINVDFNDKVKKGQVLATIDPQTYTSRVRQGQAQVAASTAQRNQAQAQAAVAMANYNRTKSLFDKGFVSQAQVDADLAAYKATQASVASAAAQIASSQAGLASNQVDLSRTTITAPIDGIVIDRKIQVGNTVAASLQAPVLFTIAQDLSQLQANISVGEADIGQLREDQTVNFTVDAFPDDSFTGTVTQVRKQPTTAQNVTSYVVIAQAANPDMKLLPGMTANADIVLQERRNVLKVPTAALRWKPADAPGAVGAGRQAAVGGATGAAGGGGFGAGGGGFGGFGGGGQGGFDGGGQGGFGGGGQRGAGGAQGAAFLGQLGLDADQLKKAQAIMADVRKQAQAAAGDDRTKLRAAMQTANQAAFAKIDVLLKPDQKAKFATLRATFGQRRGARQAGAMTAGTVYVLRKEKPVAVAVRVGGTDGTNTEIQGGLMAGDMVITGGGPKQKVQARSLLSVAGGNAARGGGGGRPGG
ncbi:MAG: efflux RND transporter periplasmic adaptor subunit [Alphaproteobacteria bacterium]